MRFVIVPIFCVFAGYNAHTAVAQEPEDETTLPFLVDGSLPPMAQFPAMRVPTSVKDVPVTALIELREKLESVFVELSSATGDYTLETVEVHVTATGEGSIVITSASVSGGVKLVFQRNRDN